MVEVEGIASTRAVGMVASDDEDRIGEVVNAAVLTKETAETVVGVTSCGMIAIILFSLDALCSGEILLLEVFVAQIQRLVHGEGGDEVALRLRGLLRDHL